LAGLGLLGVAFCFADSFRLQTQRAPIRQANRQLARTLGLVDLALMTEAVHTRHLSLSGPSSAFLAHPLALDSSPTTSWVPPP